MLGDSGVGKTSLVARLTNPSAPLNHDISATMGIEFDTQMLDTTHGKVKAQIWDTAGQERFARVLLPTYFRKAKGVILVYDVTCGKSFESLTERWMAQLEDHANGNEMAKLLVGNKCDLCPADDDADADDDDAATTNIHDGRQRRQQQQQYTHAREVSRDRALEFCARHDMEYLETSAKNGNNVLKSFERLITIVHEKNMAVRGGGSGSGGGGGKLGAGGGANNNMGGSSGRKGGYDNTDNNNNGGGTLKLDEGNVRGDGDNASSSCGC
jgi:small GTP-binding protein